ncbi:hypothetical protein V2J09_019267, partial [Rumex salicifolius]
IETAETVAAQAVELVSEKKKAAAYHYHLFGRHSIMTTENPPETWIPLTPPSHNHPSVGAADSSVTALAAAVNSDHAPSHQIGVDATQHQFEGKEDICKEKTELKKKERKKRGHRGKIFLNAYERTPKPKTPKPAKPKRVVPLQTKRKYTKKKLDKSSIVVPRELITAKDLSVVEIRVPNEKPLITKTYCRKSKLNEPAKRILDLNLDCQLEVEDSVANVKPLITRSNLNEPAKRVLGLNLDSQLEVSQVCNPKSSSSGSNSWLNLCRASLQLRCRCFSCRIRKFKPAFPKEYKRIRTASRIGKARRRRLFPIRMSREAIEEFFSCTMLLTHKFVPDIKRRKARKNRFLNETTRAEQGSLLLQRCNLLGLDHSLGGENKKVSKMKKKQASLVNKEAKVTKEKTGLDHCVGGENKKVSNKKNEQASLVNKKAKLTKEKTYDNDAPATCTKGVTPLWDKNTPLEEMVDYVTTKFEGLCIQPLLYALHLSTKIEALVDEESKQICKLLKDREDDDGYDPIKEADEAKQRWWDKQREMLHKKSELFVMVMREFLGNRAFSPWKGSVVDSHSSAYMSMVARYPARLLREDTQLCIEYTSASSHQEDETNVEIPSSQESVGSSTTPKQDTDSPESSNTKQKTKEKGMGDAEINWDELRTTYSRQNHGKQRCLETLDGIDWNAVRKADVHEIAKVIEKRGQNNILAQKIKRFLDRMIEDHGSIDLEWLRDVPPLKTKEYLGSIYGIGLKSVECLRLLTLHHHAFPVDTNVGRIAVRLGWVPLQPLPELVELHLLSNYPSMDQIQEYLWPRLYHLDQTELFSALRSNHIVRHAHYAETVNTMQLSFIRRSNIRMTMRYLCNHGGFSSIPSLMWLRPTTAKKDLKKLRNPFKDGKPSSLALVPMIKSFPQFPFQVQNREPIIEEPPSPEPELPPVQETDIEDLFMDDPDVITSIDLTGRQFMNYTNESEENDTSGAIVTLSPRIASNANPKQKFIARTRTEHQVYELPDSHPLLNGLKKREKDDRCPYLLAIWPQDKQDDQSVPGTFLIPCRTAMDGRFPLNGTYFQVNEVFVDDETSKRPINVPRNLIWNLRKKTVYCGTSTTTILKEETEVGLSSHT